jgi:hypothetical protein
MVFYQTKKDFKQTAIIIDNFFSILKIRLKQIALILLPKKRFCLLETEITGIFLKLGVNYLNAENMKRSEKQKSFFIYFARLSKMIKNNVDDLHMPLLLLPYSILYTSNTITFCINIDMFYVIILFEKKKVHKFCCLSLTKKAG